MKGKSLGWLILVGALAVPAVLFYKWWTQMKATQAAEARQAPADSAPFGGTSRPAPAPAPVKAATPSQPPPLPPGAAATPAANPPVGPESRPPAGGTLLARAPAPSAPPGPSPRPASPSAATDPAAVEPPSPGGAPLPRGGKPPSIEYAPTTSRDPMLSVFDLRELAKRKLQEEMARRQVEQAAQEESQAPPPPPPKPLCDSFELQGIISTPNGIAAIVNDRVVSEGDRISGAVIARITTRTVVFKKGRKSCMKRVSK